ncbi:hypothetical protein [Companilactobacillus ginsenosidimutans]|uniref:Uncharacterized protein n=1 Tax=Companilactobacillus ginsenosidimutans TaxID=1007676 RepID=A0A0H4QM94_9LACO|nr:hypothetical protein [Companilactobacillus ginsenosidimutans]AKP67828.1 hypothetical protein ABM34_09995 [Companilactobacillus ginsenosidimutans]
MKNKSDMSDGDFQKLIRICMNDLSIQRTLLENDMQEQRDDLRTLEQDQNIDKLERRIMLIKKDYDHYADYLDPAFSKEEINY